MRYDLARFVPQVASTELLMCPCCGRFLRQKHFSLEHIIPQQVLADDPPEIRAHPLTPVNVRAGTMLLCTKPLKYGRGIVHQNGCNSWKGKWFDGCVREALNLRLTGARQKKNGGHHMVAMMAVAYLALVSRYGYAAVITQSGLLMRRQFFSPMKFVADMPDNCQVFMGGASKPFDPNNLNYWANPFTFDFKPEVGSCWVGIRSTVTPIPVPITPSTVLPSRLIMPFTNPNTAQRPRFDVFSQ